jgi:hypothetical protein
MSFSNIRGPTQERSLMNVYNVGSFLASTFPICYTTELILEKGHSMNECKTFPDVSYLTEKSHTREKPYVCTKYGKVFTDG